MKTRQKKQKRLQNKAPRSRRRLFFFSLSFAITGALLVFAVFAASDPPVATQGQILFSSSEGSKTKQLWKTSGDGSKPIQLTNDANHEHEWSRPSPDGNKILYMKASAGSSVNFAMESNELWIMNIDGSDQRSIIDGAKRNRFGWSGMGHAEWSPDSSKIVLVANMPNQTNHIFVTDSSGNNPKQITQDVQIDGHKTLPLDPSWSNTNQIVFARQWNCFYICGSQDIFKIDYLSGKETRITNDPQWNFDPYISPDGRYYLWLSFRTSPIVCPCDLIRGNTSGDLNPQPVIADDGSNANGTFSADSKTILFLKSDLNKQVLHSIGIDGKGLKKLALTNAGESGIASFIENNQQNPGDSAPQEPPASPPSTGNPTQPPATTPTQTSPTNPAPPSAPTIPLETVKNVTTKLDFSLWSGYSITLNWSPPSGGSSDLTYSILRNGTTLSTTSSTSYTDRQVTPNTTYSYVVQAQQNQTTTTSPATKVALECWFIFCSLKDK